MGMVEEMDKLLDTNPGLRSRFPTVLQFNDYSPEELLEIADQMLLQDVLVLSQAAAERLRHMFQEWRGSGNGRAVRHVLERAKRNQALRLQQGFRCRSHDELCTLLPED